MLEWVLGFNCEGGKGGREREYEIYVNKKSMVLTRVNNGVNWYERKEVLILEFFPGSSQDSNSAPSDY